MKHLKKFEELSHSTYNKVADVMDSKGQNDKAKRLRDHAFSSSRKSVDDISFGILVGGVRPFPNAKFDSMRIFKSGEGWILDSIFKSDNNTHRISSSVISEKIASVVWREGNKFLNRKSVMDFEKSINSLSNSQEDLKNFMRDNGIDIFKVDYRTFYT